jgi:peptidyl-prolyl cis-trans isomerase B (cyclophilin B)
MPNLIFEMKVETAVAGEIVLSGELYPEYAPNTVRNFVALARKGFYNGKTFHRVVHDAYVQTGCPNGDGTGNAGYFIKCELHTENPLRHELGTLSMAHCGRNTGSTQFFICINRRNVYQFDGNHTCFGSVKKGVHMLDDIREGDVVKNIDVFERE